MHADGYAGFEDLYRTGAIREVACMAHVRRKFVDIFRSQGSPIAEEAIGRIAQLYAVEKEARGSPPDRRAELRQAHAAPIFDDLERWLAMQLTTISGKSPLAAAIRYALTRMDRLRPYLDHGILELDNNAAERGMRAIALGRKNYLFVGSEAGGKAAAIAYTLIETAKLNAVDRQGDPRCRWGSAAGSAAAGAGSESCPGVFVRGFARLRAEGRAGCSAARASLRR